MFATEYTAVIQEERWRAQARCADTSSALVDLFFSEQLDDILGQIAGKLRGRR